MLILCITFQIFAVINCASVLMVNYDDEDDKLIQCTDLELRCDYNKCIPNSKVCDGIQDCETPIDEAPFKCGNQVCKPFEFKCSYGACISMNKVCDLKWDCADGSDEAGCEDKNVTKKCRKSQMACNSGKQCIWSHERCDGTRNCDDSSDETYQACFGTNCEPGSFQCDYGACIPSKGRCDGHIDCADGSDELNCKNSILKITNETLCGVDGVKCPSGICIKKSQLCDGLRNCEDGYDETDQLCSQTFCYGDSFRCWNGACIPKNKMTCNHCVNKKQTLQWVRGNDLLRCVNGVLTKIPPPVPSVAPAHDSFLPTTTSQNTGLSKPTTSRPPYSFLPPSTRAPPSIVSNAPPIRIDGSVNGTLPNIIGFGGYYPAYVGNGTIVYIGFNSEEYSSASSGSNPNNIHKPKPQCLFPPPPLNGNYSSPKIPNIEPNTVATKFTVLEYICEEDYELNGEAFIVCNGKKWNHPPPECALKCPPIGESENHEIACSFNNREVDCDEAFEGVVANVQCKESFEVTNFVFQPSNGIKCHNGNWSSPLFNCEPECGTIIPKAQALVVKGYLASRGEFPWHAGIYQFAESGEAEQTCGGTIITERLVISAAHCFWDWSAYAPKTNTDKFGIAVGKFYRTWNTSLDPHAQYFGVERISLPNKFRADSNSFANDIAIITIKGSFQINALVRPVCLDYSNTLAKTLLKPGAFGAVVGWGLTEEFGNAAEELQAVQMPYVEYDKCVSELPLDFRPFITNDKLCAGYKNGTSICQGDSGGGIAFRKSNRYFIQGVVSVAPAKGSTCDSFQYAAFTNIGSHLPWIEEVENDIFKGRELLP